MESKLPSAEEVLNEMKDVMPFVLSDNVYPYIKEALILVMTITRDTTLQGAEAYHQNEWITKVVKEDLKIS